MEFNFGKTVTILGTVYAIEIKKPDEDPGFKRYPGAYGFMDSILKRIVLCDRTDSPVWKDTDEKCVNEWLKKTLRHEIVHAFLEESGLGHNTRIAGSWAKNEEMVDWIAIQGVKLVAAWTEAGAL